MINRDEDDRLSGREPTDATVRSSGSPYRSTWVSRLFPSSDLVSVVRRAALLSAAYFLVGLVLSIAVGQWASYLFLNRPFDGWSFLDVNFLGVSAVMGSVGIFIELTIIGQWSVAYSHIWDRVEACFAADERAQFRRIVDGYLDRMYRIRFDRVVDLKLIFVAFVVFEPVFIVVGNGLDPRVGWELVLIYLNVWLVFLGFVAIFLFLLHLRLLIALRTLKIANLHTAASQFEPVSSLGVSVAVSWFVGVTTLVVYYWLDSGISLFEPFTSRGGPVTAELALHLSLTSVLVIVGLLIFAVPVWVIHLHIVTGKRHLVDAIDQRRDELLVGWTVGTTLDPSAVGEIGLLEDVQRNADRIRTWPSFVSDLIPIAVSAFVPIAEIVIQVL
ncbi:MULTISPECIES: hypothetical protein [Haloferax]|uniref:Uncharacterized protein n=1 Tax=Haloferax marinum TaxID=2666143 RepID=A0A6A8G606_9EURY|nr:MULTISPECIES: hypothetical protein [Haloferax]KAB1196696.1 hypothetical protein Hfx1150_03840 [Haloferax sp. CBA1150]MRW95703.1 hypothetical protein [Haloferax marinum]